MKMNDKTKDVVYDLAGFGVDTAVSLLASGIPIPATFFLKNLYYVIKKPSKERNGFNLTNPNLEKYILSNDTEFIPILAKKLVHDYFESNVGNREEIYKSRQISRSRFNFIKESSENKIHLPISNQIYTKDATYNESVGYAPANYNSLDFIKRNEFLANEISKRKEKITINITSVCASSVAVILSMMERYNLNVELNFHFANARTQMEIILFEANKNIDFLFTANPTFSFHSDDLLSIQKWTLLRELHYEHQYLMRNPKKNNVFNSNNNISVYGKSTAEEQYYLIKNSSDYKKNIISNFSEYPNLNYNFVFAWEPLSFHLESKGWKKIPKTEHQIIFSIFGKDNKRTSLLNKYFMELFCKEWLYCRQNLFQSLEMLLSRSDFVEKFKVGSGLK